MRLLDGGLDVVAVADLLGQVLGQVADAPGRVPGPGEDGAPADPGAYEYDRAARDALSFAALFDRFLQNLRRYLGYDLRLQIRLQATCKRPLP